VAHAAATGALTDPDQASRLAAETGIACLAVSIGNVHGHYAAPPELRWDLLSAVARRVTIPLALHGASGLPPEDVRRAIRGGIRKVNVNTELREAYLDATVTAAKAARKGARLTDLHKAQVAAVAAVAKEKIDFYD
jgi:fructose/tagatose bisphosphate aldolase